jgi:hypothetical protein
MPHTPETDDLLLQTRHILAHQIKLDIAKALQETPHIPPETLQELLSNLTQADVINTLIAELAQEEIQHALQTGEKPAIHMLKLAGYPQHKHRET